MFKSVNTNHTKKEVIINNIAMLAYLPSNALRRRWASELEYAEERMRTAMLTFADRLDDNENLAVENLGFSQKDLWRPEE